jgi:hypothetical protein
MAKVTIVDVKTGETIEREETAEELAIRKTTKEEWLAKKAIQEAKIQEQIAQKQSILNKLGLTEEEAKILLS